MDTNQRLLPTDKHLEEVTEKLTEEVLIMTKDVIKACKRIRKSERIEYISTILIDKLNRRGFDEIKPFLSLFFLQPGITSEKIDEGTCIEVKFLLSCALEHNTFSLKLNITDEIIEGV